MNTWHDFSLKWFADYYLLATLLLTVALAAALVVRQPARRLAIAWASVGALLLLAVLVALPGWSFVHLFTSPPPLPSPTSKTPAKVVVVSPREEPIRTNDFELLPTYPIGENTTSLARDEPATAGGAMPKSQEVSKSLYLVIPLLAGSTTMLLWLALGAWQTRRLVQRSAPAPEHVNHLLASLTADDALRPRLRLSSQVATGVALGLRRPTILLHRGDADRRDTNSLRAILAHELAHVRNGDLWLLAALRLLMVILWAHPLYWLVRRRVRLDQETLADAAAAEISSRETYAEQLVGWARELNSSRPPAFAGAVGLWESKSQLRKRIAVLLDERLTVLRDCSRQWKLSAVALCAVAAVGLSLVTMEPEKSVAEEVAKHEVAELVKHKVDASHTDPTTLTGTVVGPDDKPLAGVKVDAWTWYSGNETETDEQGQFELTGFDPEEEVQVEFTKAEYCPRHFTAKQAGSSDWVIKMGNRTWIEGQLTDQEGSPLAGVEIQAERGPFQNPGVVIDAVRTSTQTDKEGNYRLYLEPDTYEIKVRVPASGVYRREALKVLNASKRRFDIALESGITFQARIVDSETGKPVEGITLWNWRHNDTEASSDADGILKIPAMFPGKFEFNVTAVGANRRRDPVASDYARWWSPDAVNEYQRESIRPGEFQRNFDSLGFDLQSDMNPVTIIVERTAIVTGRVLDPDGNPVAGATVAPAKTGSGNSITGDTRYSYSTKEDGTFVAKLPASKGVVYNLVAHDGKHGEWRTWANGVGEPFATQPGQTVEDVELYLTRPATVRGRVLDAQGKPVVGKRVRAAAFDKLDNRYYHPETRTDAEGRFELKFIRPGKHYIQSEPFWLQADNAPDGTSKLVELEAGEVLEDVNIVPPGLPAGKKLLQLPDGQEVLIDEGALGNVTPSLRIRVLTANGKPAAGAKIHSGIWADEPFRGNRDYICDVNGEAVVEYPKSLQILRLWARLDGHVPEFIQIYNEETYSTPVPELFTFELAKGTEIGGTIVNEAGEPIVGATIEVSCDAEREQDGVAIVSRWLAEDETAIHTDEQGRWTLDNVPAGDDISVNLKLEHPDYINDMQWGELQKAQSVTLATLRDKSASITMHEGIVLEGKVLGSDGKPVEGAVVVWGDDPYDQPGSQEVVTDSEGAYRLPPLPPGMMTLTVVAKGWAPELRKIDVGPLAATTFKLQKGKPLRIRFVDTAGKTVPNTYIGIEKWQDSKSLYNHRHPNVINTHIPHQANTDGLYEWIWAPDYPIYLYFGAKGYHSVYSKPFRANSDQQYVVTLRREDEPDVDDPTLEEAVVETVSEEERAASDTTEVELTDDATRQTQGDPTDFYIVIARHMMLLDGKEFITWPDIEDKIALLKDASRVHLHYYVTRGAREAGQEEFFRLQHRELEKKFGFSGYSIGSLWPRTDFRYDQLKTAADLAPTPDHAMAGQVVDVNGDAVAGAEVLLIEPVDESIPYKAIHMAFVDGRVRNRLEHVMTTSDKEGRFTVYPSSENVKYYVLAMHPDAGFAFVRHEGRKNIKPLELAPWASVNAKILPLEGYEQSAGLSLSIATIDDWPEIKISHYAEDRKEELPAGEFRFPCVPPKLQCVFRRSIQKSDGSSIGLPTREFELKPGEKQTLEIGDFNETERQHLDLHERMKSERDD